MSSVLQEELSSPEYVDVRNHLDFAANIVLVLAAYVMRCTGYMKDEHVSGLKFLTFGISLPVMICSVLWTAEFKAELLIVMALSVGVHTFIPFASFLMYIGIKPVERRGYMTMVNQGEGLAYAYQATLNTFGPVGLTALCLWDLGGNLWLAIVGNGVAASVFRPPVSDGAAESAAILGGEPPAVIGQTIRQRYGNSERKVSPGTDDNSAAHADQAPNFEPVMPSSASQSTPDQNSKTSLNFLDLESMASVLEDPAATASRGALGTVAGSGERCFNTVSPIVKLPMLWGVVIGLTLNACGVPLHYMPIKVMHVLSQCFPPLLYVLLGSVLRFRLGPREYAIVLQALACRWLLYAAIASAIWLSPLEKFVRGIVVLSLATPVSTTLLIYGAEFGYDAARCAMSYNISALLSFVAIHFLNTLLIAEGAV